MEHITDTQPSGHQPVFKKVLIANRGAIACRIIRTLKKMSIASVAIYSEADSESLHVQLADEAVALPGVLASESYLNMDRVIEAAKSVGAQAIHPGYGFLSENSEFAKQCDAAGIIFIGPKPHQLDAFGLKHTARELAQQSGVPLVPGSDLLQDEVSAIEYANKINYPIMLKSTAGGGGIGMQVCWDDSELRDAFTKVKRLSKNNFGNDGIFLEKYIADARHIEVQIVGDGKGVVVALGERDCSLQRRNQKVIEEAPAPNLSSAMREQMIQAAIALGESVAYQSAGTVEFIFDAEQQQFYFLEMNTRLQVEHGVTELVFDVDLVEWMILVAANQAHFLGVFEAIPKGHAIQARIYAEDPAKQFQPSSGLLTHVTFPEWAGTVTDGINNGVRIDHWIEAGITVPAYYDPMLVKMIAYGNDRHSAMQTLHDSLSETKIEGITTNIQYLKQVLLDDIVKEVSYNTRFLNSFVFHGEGMEILKPGTQTTIQDYPGREGYWHIGVPPSGPMDNLSFRLGNQILGNAKSAAGLEITLNGPTILFRCETVIALTGAEMSATRICGESQETHAVSFWQPIVMKAGDTLEMGQLKEAGLRSYLCVKGGIQISDYLGSKSTFTLGQFGGHGGRALSTGDLIAIHPAQLDGSEYHIDEAHRPQLTHHWQVAVLYGPHGSPEFFTPNDMETFFSTHWEVHFNSSRTGVRLIGPKPEWAREDGGEAGLHPSNIHDNAYAIGAVDFTGDMPVILGPDGPSLGGFVCPVTIIKADLWKMGQLKPGDTVEFVPVEYSLAEQLEREQHTQVEHLCFTHATINKMPLSDLLKGNCWLHKISKEPDSPEVTYRQSGDDNILVEYGEMELDLNLRFRVHALMNWLEEKHIGSILELTPGIRSLQIQFNNLTMSQEQLLELLIEAEEELPAVEEMVVPARIVHLPLSWDDESTRLAIEKYMTTVRSDAPWCPSNIEFIRRINGLDSIEQVKEILFSASYLVMGLGDVYLGAPVATPLDPRHRLVTTKYNPARTWTPENAVGIGGAYLCVYGMEGPGGYQFVGRTMQMWNRFRSTPAFAKPWLLRVFDQIRFYPVSHEELQQIRKDLPLGRFVPKIEETEFNLQEYQAFLTEQSDSIETFRTKQRQAFSEERARWKAAGIELAPDLMAPAESPEAMGEGEEPITASVPGSVWQVKVCVGDKVKPGDLVAVVESMKMEFNVEADAAGTVKKILVKEGQQIGNGQHLLVIDTQ